MVLENRGTGCAHKEARGTASHSPGNPLKEKGHVGE